MNDIVIHDALVKSGYESAGYERPYHLFKNASGRIIGYCFGCGLLLEIVKGEKFRIKWKTRGLEELLTFANEGTIIK